MSPSGGYLFLYPGSISRIFLFGTSHYLHCLLSAEIANLVSRFGHTTQAAVPLQCALRRPIELGRELAERRGEVFLVALRRPSLFHHVGGDLHERVDAHGLAKKVFPGIVPLVG